MHLIEQTDEGLALVIDGHTQALIRERGGCLDMVWAVRGPQSLEVARQVVVGLLDLMVHYDAMQVEAPAVRKRSGSEFG